MGRRNGKWIFLLMMSISACGNSSPTSPSSNAMELSVFMTRDSAGSREIRAVVSNRTQQEVDRWEGCASWHGMNLYFVSKDHLELLLVDPLSRPRCPDSLVSLPAGSMLEAKSVLPDTLFTWDGVPVELSPGAYYAVVRFDWREMDNRTLHSIIHSVSFQWP